MKSSMELYNLNLATAVESGGSIESAPTRVIQKQIDAGFISLRFMRSLEGDFHRYLRDSSRLSRASLIFLAVASVLSCALIDVSWLGMPYELVGTVRFLQFVVMMPMAFICIFLCLRFPATRAMEVGIILLLFVFTVGLLGMRIVASRTGFSIPVEMVGLSAVAMTCLSRIRLWVQVPVLVGVAAVTFAVEIQFVEIEAAYDLFVTAMLFVVALFAGYSLEHNLRWTWLNGVLLRYLSRLDRLTGLLNRHALESALASAHDHARRDRKAYAVAMIDIDAFGAYNNHYGHQYGDAALQQMADALASHARRPLDCCGRYGGEEFVLLWMDCGVEQAHALAESVREVVENQRIAHAHSPAAPWVTISVGLCHVGVEHVDASMESVLREADGMLYEAKANGRNQVGHTRYTTPRASASAPTSGEAASSLHAGSSE